MAATPPAASSPDTDADADAVTGPGTDRADRIADPGAGPADDLVIEDGTPPEGEGSADVSPARSRRRPTWFHWALAALALGGFAFRAGYVLETRSDTSLCGIVVCGDAIYYSWQAEIVGQGKGFYDIRDLDRATADHPPLTVLALAPATILRGGQNGVLTEQRLLMAFYGSLVIVAMGLLGRAAARSLRRARPGRAEAVGLVAAAIAAVNANFWMNDVVVMSETLATLAVVLALWATYRFIDRPSWMAAAAVGALIGMAALARAELAMLGPVMFLPVALWARSLPWTARVARVAVAAGAVLVVLAPWTIYNLGRFDQPVLMSTNDGLTLIGANCDEVYEGGAIGFWKLSCAYAVDPEIPAGADQSVASSVYRRHAVDHIRDNLDRLPAVVVARQGRLWGAYQLDAMVSLNTGEGRAPWASWTGLVQWWLLVPLAAAGAVVVRRRRDHLWPLASTFVVVAITGVAFYGIGRFRIAADVGATVLAAVALEAGWHWVRARRAAPAAVPSVPGGPAGAR